MTGLCVLTAELNNCQHYIRECAGCNAPHDKCGMFRPAESEQKDGSQKKPPKWFEQYHK